MNSKTKQTYAPVNGLNLYYEMHGESSDHQKTPLMLIHGGGSTLDTCCGEMGADAKPIYGHALLPG